MTICAIEYATDFDQFSVVITQFMFCLNNVYYLCG